MATCIPNGKVYIGKTCEPLTRRKIEHKSNALSGINFVFYKAIRKYGWESFEWEVIDRCLFPDMLCKLEKLYIKKFNSKVPHGYNLTIGGDGASGLECSEETRKKISEANKGEKSPMFGKHPSIETRKKISDSKIGKNFGRVGEKHPMFRRTGDKNPNFGRHHTEEAKMKISDARSGRPLSEEHKRKIGLGGIGRHHSENTKRKISESRKSYERKKHESGI